MSPQEEFLYNFAILLEGIVLANPTYTAAQLTECMATIVHLPLGDDLTFLVKSCLEAFGYSEVLGRSAQGGAL